MLPKYLVSFLLGLVLVCSILSMLPFAIRALVQTGTTMEETWINEFTLDATSSRMYQIDANTKAALENGIAFVGSGAVHVGTTKVEITPQEVSWTENRTRYTAPGARMVTHVTWNVPADAGDGTSGDIHVEFPRLPQIPNYVPGFHSGMFQKTGDGRFVFREVTAHRSAAAIAIGRFVIVLGAAVPLTILLHSIWWFFQIGDEKRVRLAALAQSSSHSLPRMFYSSPVEEWETFTVILCMFAFVGSVLAGFDIYDGFVSSFGDSAFFIITVIGILIAIIAALYARSSVVTVRVDVDAISYAKGRGEPHWVTARWSELNRAVLMSEKSSRGSTTEWVELTFPDGTTRKIPSSLIDYPILRDMVLVLYERQRQTASTPDHQSGIDSMITPKEKPTMVTGSPQAGSDPAATLPANKPAWYLMPARLHVFLLFMFQFVSLLAVGGFGFSYLPDPLLPKILAIAAIVLGIVVVNIIASVIGRVIPVRCGRCRLRTRFLGLGWWPFIYRYTCSHCGMEMRIEVQGGA